MENCTHKYRNEAVRQLNEKQNMPLADHPVCMFCGWDQLDQIYRCIKCFAVLEAWEVEHGQHKCKKHLDQPNATPIRL